MPQYGAKTFLFPLLLKKKKSDAKNFNMRTKHFPNIYLKYPSDCVPTDNNASVGEAKILSFN